MTTPTSTSKENPWTEVLEKVAKLAKKTANDAGAAQLKAAAAVKDSEAAQERAAVAQAEAELAQAKVAFAEGLAEICARQAEDARRKLEHLVKRAEKWEEAATTTSSQVCTGGDSP